MKCWECGKTILKGSTYRRNYCQDCEIEKNEQRTKDYNEYWRLKNKMMIERAVKKIENAIYLAEPISFYKDAMEVVLGYTEKYPTKIASTEEAITAIVLIANKIQVKCQYSILKFRVDFLLPDLQTVLEIDGDSHNLLKDSKRDLQILHELGEGWEIVRLTTLQVNKNPQLLLNTILEERIKKEDYRVKNGKTLAIEIANILKEKELERENKRKVKEFEEQYIYGRNYTRIKK